VDGERIFAALDAYLMIGLMFAICYAVLDKVDPASFGSPSEIDLTMDRAIYFSFVTIATLGYGDIVPLGGLARGLAILEAVTGQMYLAVLVAWLVSLFARTREA
jgi:voltage-gated potassium channel